MNNIVKLESGKSVEFQGDRNKSVHKGGSLLGKGGQGAVYLVKECDTERTFALKVYNTPVSNVFVENLRKNIANGAPNDSFVWPLDLTEPMGKNSDQYGYTMELFEYSNYTSFARILKGKTTFPSKEKQIQTLMNLAKAIDSLHSRGLCYQDLNDGNVMFDCQNGKVLICDNDNIAPCGINIPFDSEGHCIQGKLKYMAPEVAAKILKPDEYSDRFSLAVLIFMILLHAHPFDGVKRLEGQLTVSVQEKIYGTEPVFIFHPTDKSNHPDPQIDINAIKAWPTIPDFIQDLFIKTFTSGMPSVGKRRDDLQIERQGRTSEKEWREALHRWIDTTADCPNCNHAICATIQGNAFVDTKCPHCGKKVKVVRPILIIKKNGKVERTIVLEAGKEVAKSSVTNERSNEPAFVVKRSKKVSDAFGIENLLPYQWKCSQKGSKDRLVNTHEMVAAFNGVYIEFDYTYSGEIIYSKY